MPYFTKKILLLTFTAFLFLAATKTAKAQVVTGSDEFNCLWTEGGREGVYYCGLGYTDSCFVKEGDELDHNYEWDTETDFATCRNYQDQESCEAAGPFACTFNLKTPDEPEPEDPPIPTGTNKYYCQINSAKNGCELAEKSNTCDAANGYAPGDLCPSVPYEFCDEAASAGLDCVYTGSPGCGEINQPCCPNIGCHDVTTSRCDLSVGMCVACGELGQACCLVTHPCGLSNELYCTGNGVCEKLPNTEPPKPKANTSCNGVDGIDTAIGCIPIGSASLMTIFLMNWALGIGGGVSFLLIVFAAFQIMTSGGDPKKLQGGKELMTAAIGGTILLIFSSFLLRALGFNILGIF